MKVVTIANYLWPLTQKKCFQTIYILHQHQKFFRDHFIQAAKKYIEEFKLKPKKSYIIDIGSNDGVALKPFKDLKFKKILGIEPTKNLAKQANKNKLKHLTDF